MTLKQVLHDKNNITEVNAILWEIKLLAVSLFSHVSCSYNWCCFYRSGPYRFYFFHMVLKTSNDTALCVGLSMSYISLGDIDQFSSEPWMEFRPYYHQCPWFLWYDIPVCISSWALLWCSSPDALYIEISKLAKSQFHQYSNTYNFTNDAHSFCRRCSIILPRS